MTSFDILALDAWDLRGLSLSLAHLLVRPPDAIFVAPFEGSRVELAAPMAPDHGADLRANAGRHSGLTAPV